MSCIRFPGDYLFPGVFVALGECTSGDCKKSTQYKEGTHRECAICVRLVLICSEFRSFRNDQHKLFIPPTMKGADMPKEAEKEEQKRQCRPRHDHAFPRHRIRF